MAFYVIEKILRNKDPNSVVVFVCPTKALVNQVYVDLYAKYEKRYSNPKRSMQGIFTADEKFSYLECQVLSSLQLFNEAC